MFDVHELGRRPGVMRAFQRSIPAPPDLGLDLARVAEASAIELDVRLESVTEGIWLSGSATADVVGECARCLRPLHYPMRAQLQELYAHPNSMTDKTTDADEVHRVVDELVDAEPAVRDAVVLALPSTPLCREDCPGAIRALSFIGVDTFIVLLSL